MARNDDDSTNKAQFQWTAVSILQAIVIFILAGAVAEILGGWMVWTAIRGISNTNQIANRAASGISNAVSTQNASSLAASVSRMIAKNMKKTWWYALCGCILLIIYGFLPTLQPTDSFGRIYAVYGGFFIVMSFLIGWFLDGDKPDLGDITGGIISLLGVMVIMFWPRGS